jgi:hypothetical protein
MANSLTVSGRVSSTIVRDEHLLPESSPPPDAAVMRPVVRGELWPLLHREVSLVYVGTAVHARCRASTVELSLDTGTALREELKGDESAVPAGRAVAKLLGLVSGRDRKMYGHVLICNRISKDAKANAEAYYFSKNDFGAAPTLYTSTAASANGQSTLPLAGGGASPTFAPPQPSAKRRKSSKSTSIAEYGLFGERFKHDKDHHWSAC